MTIEADADVSLFVREPTTGRRVFNSKAIQALGLSPIELVLRGYPLDVLDTNPPLAPEDGATDRPAIAQPKGTP